MGNYVVFVHGIGEQQPDSYYTFGESLRAAYNRKVKNTGVSQAAPGLFEWEEAYWANVTQPDQQLLKSKADLKGRLRQFSIGSIGDIIAYSKLNYPPDKYGEIQQRFTDTITKLSQKARQNSDANATLTVIGHSLGSVIASDGIYDLTSKNALPQNLKLDNFFTMGSPIALYGLRYGLANFTRPVHPKLWINFFYRQDLIAFPLKTLNSAYASAVTEDNSLSPGGGTGLFSGLVRQFEAMLPLVGIASHSWYFNDTRVINRIAESLV